MFLDWLAEWWLSKRRPVAFRFKAGAIYNTTNCSWRRGIIKESFQMNLKDNEKVTLSITPVNAKGNPAPLDGVPVWTTENPSVVAITPSADGLSCECVAGVSGSSVVTVSGDADMGEGVTKVAGSITFDVTPGAAVSIVIVPGTVSNQ